MAITRAPRRRHSWMAVEPTPPEAPVTSTQSPGPGLMWRIMPSAVEKATMKVASSASEYALSTATALASGTVVYCA